MKYHESSIRMKPVISNTEIEIRELTVKMFQMRKLKNEINIRKNNQKKISESLIDVMRKNEIDEFELKDGKIMYCKKNIKNCNFVSTIKKLLVSYLHTLQWNLKNIITFYMEWKKIWSS